MVSCDLGAELFLGFPAPSLTARCHLSRPALTTHFLVFFFFLPVKSLSLLTLFLPKLGSGDLSRKRGKGGREHGGEKLMQNEQTVYWDLGKAIKKIST